MLRLWWTLISRSVDSYPYPHLLSSPLTHTPPPFLLCSTKGGFLHAWWKKKKDHSGSRTPGVWSMGVFLFCFLCCVCMHARVCVRMCMCVIVVRCVVGTFRIFVWSVLHLLISFHLKTILNHLTCVWNEYSQLLINVTASGCHDRDAHLKVAWSYREQFKECNIIRIVKL